jgi:hypothetical protein
MHYDKCSLRGLVQEIVLDINFKAKHFWQISQKKNRSVDHNNKKQIK